VVAVPVAAPASSLQQQQKEFADKVQAAKSPAELRALLAQAKPAMEQTLKTKPNDFDGKQADPGQPAEPNPDEPPAEPAADAAPVQGDEPAADETPAEETPADPEANELEAEPGDDDGGEGPIEPLTGKRTHLRLAQNDKVGRLAAAFMRRNRDLSMEGALDRARDQLGIKAPGTPDEPAGPESNLPKTVDEATAEIAKLRAERKKANTDLRFEEVSDLSDKLEDLIQHRFTLERLEEKKQVEAASAYDQQFAASEQRAVDLFDFAGKPDSPGGQRMLEIEQSLKDTEDPRYYSPNKPLIVAQLAAAELKIAPRRKGAPPVPAKAAAPANGVPPAKKNVLPSGGSRTTPIPQNQPPAIIAETQKIQSAAEWRAFKKKAGLRF
jgi:hypothetical protein